AGPVRPMRLTIMLTTRGAQTAKPRPVELYAWPDADRLVIVGSSGGSARHPAWVHNLRAHPQATVQRGKQIAKMTAREVTDPDERAHLWPFVAEQFPLYGTYQRRTKRLIPLFVLEAPPPRAG
ncbi:MAG: nitroreductase/quinone reductase family protein, partial [Candidatus Limnocylindria bacterium]